MNALVPQNFGPLSTRFTGVAKENDLGAGVQTGYPILGYKGKVWSIRRGGSDPVPLMRPDGDGPMNSVEAVILKASTSVSKIWYEQGYVEGSTASPDCFSTNGVTPDASSKKKQCNACAICPQNQWGARITPAGKQGKACSDSKRIAVAPLNDIRNEKFGGPMLLRIPAASLRDLAGYGEKMNAVGYPYFSIGTRIAFDPGEAYPKFVFSAIRPLTDAEADVVMEVRESRAVSSILAEGSEVAHTAPTPPPAASLFEQPPAPAPQPIAAPIIQAAAPAPKPAPVQASTGFGVAADPAPAPAPAPAPVQTAAPTPPPAANTSSFEDDLDAQLDKLLA